MSGPSKISKHVEFKFPKLSSKGPPTYRSFIKYFIHIPGNRKAFRTIDKETFDAEHERQTRDIYKSDESTLRRYIDEYKSIHAQRQWQSARRAFKVDEEQTDSNIGETIKRLKSVPPIGRGPGDTDDEIDNQSYAKFAIKVEKENPDFAFTKDIMDRIFEHKASSTTVSSNYGKIWRNMLKRCLGSESDRYWKSRR